MCPATCEDISSAYLREAQLMAMSEPNTGMAVTNEADTPSLDDPDLDF